MTSTDKKSYPISKGGRKPRFPELPPKYSSSRELRNKAEKLRRDRLNKLVEEMHSLVPIICNKTNKSEKTRTNILRLTANYLKVSSMFPNQLSVEKPNMNKSDLIGEGIPHLESMEGFFVIIAEDGKVLFVSENVEKFIRFSQVEMMGHPISDFTHPSDQKKIHANLSKKDSISSPPSISFNLTSVKGRGPRQSFYIRLREKPLTKQDDPKYEHMHVVGHVRKTENASLEQYTFVGVIKPVSDRPITELSLMESIQDQYLTRHLPDGRIIYSDHRISTIAGYLPSDVKGKSAFNFFYAEDLPWTTMAMRHMFASSNGEGTTVYRLFTQTGELICLQTKGFLEFNKTTNKIESFLCINTLIKPEDAQHYLNQQKERFTPFITELEIDVIKTQTTNHCESMITSANFSPYSTTAPLTYTRELSQNPLKRKVYQESSDSEPETKKCLPHKYMAGLSQAERQDLDEGKHYNTNCQYTPARKEPQHRSEDGVRVVDIDHQPISEGQNGFLRQDCLPESQIDFKGLINQFNSSHQTKQEFSQDKTSFLELDNPSAMEVERTNSVIKMLPKFNPPMEYIPREVDIIKQEIRDTSTNQADRIAEKLKVMLAQSRIVDGRTLVKLPTENVSVSAAVYAKSSPEKYQDSDLLETLEQDLLFSRNTPNIQKKSFVEEKLFSKTS